MNRLFTSIAVGVFACTIHMQAIAAEPISTYALEAGTGHIVPVAQSVVFYDDGGADANITPGFEGTVTFVPEGEGKLLRLNTDEFSIGGGKMFVYSGREADDANILGRVTGYFTTNGPADLLSKASDGSITVSFKAHATASTLKGWVMNVTAEDVLPMGVQSIAVSDGVSTEVVRGSGNAPVARLAVSIAGNFGKVAVSGVSVDVNGSTSVADVKGLKVFYTASNEVFAPVNAVSATVTDIAGGKAEIAFTSPVEFDEAGTYYFWITADVAGEAAAGNTVVAAVTAVETTGSAVAVPEANSGSCTLKAGFGGTFRIGQSETADFHSIAEAVEALAAGVENTVLFMLEDGEYKENVLISNVQGASAGHPIVFSSISGNADKVVISGAEALNNLGVITVENSSYVNLRNLTVAVPAPTSSTKPYAAVLFRNGSRYCSIENCLISADVTSGAETSLVRTADGGAENTNCDYLTVKGSRFEGGHVALYLAGTSYVARPKMCGVTITDNVFVNPSSKGLYITDIQDFVVAGNTVTSETAKKSYCGLEIFRPHGAYRITGNKVTMLQTTDGTGIYLRTGGGVSNPENPALVANNVVAITNASSNTYGIMLDTSIADLIVAHNTVSVRGDAALKSVYALALSGTAPANGAAQIVNNILQNFTAQGPLRPWNDSHYTNLKFSGNVYFGGADVIDGDGKTFAEYSQATGDNTSLWKQVSFFNNTDLHLREADADMAMPRQDAVTTDAEGTERPQLTTAGAYEFAPVVVAVPEIMEGYPAVGALKDVTVTVNTCWTVGGDLHALAVKASAPAPTRDELLAARSVAADADKEVPYTFNALDQLTAYKAYFLMVSALGEESDVVVSQEFTTSETIEPLMVVIDWDEEPVAAGENISLQAYPVGGKAPYTYRWLNQMDEPVGEDEVLSFKATVNQTVRVEVKSADGQSARTKTLVPVIDAALAVASFDDLPLAPESNRIYDSYATEDTYVDAFFSCSFRFGNFPMVEWGAWMGYGYANETATAFNNDYTNQMRNVVGGGAAQTANYGVAYMMMADMTITVSADDKGLVVPGVYITNAAVTAEKILEGDGWCQKFTAANNDYMTLKISGYDAAGAETGVVEVPLADYRGEYGESGGYVLTDWKWCDLSSLGAVNSLKLDFASSQQEQVPAYVCFDEFGAANPLGGVEAVADGETDIRIVMPSRNSLAVIGTDGDYTLRIYTIDGVLRATHSLNGAATVSTAGIPSGTCIAEVITADGSRSVLRFIKR